VGVPKARELEQQIRHAESHLHLYRKIARLMGKPVPLSEALHKLVGYVADCMGADSCLLYLAGDGELVLVAAQDPRAAASGSVRLRLDEGLTGWVAREKRVLAISREAYNDARFKLFRDLPEDTFEAFLSAPVLMRGRVVGVINLQHCAPHAHTGDEIEMLSATGELAGCLVAMEQAGLPGPETNYAEMALRGVPAAELG
jgi:uroporphyrinogen-III synthase